MTFEDKVVVVTGGGSGIGAALAERFIIEGAKGVVVADLNGDNAMAVTKKLGGKALAVKCDVSDEQQIIALVLKTETHFGPIDIFCSNAGVLTLDDPGWSAASAPNERWQLAWDVHVMAHVYAARACLPGMIERGSGTFLNTVSAAGLLNQIGGAPYSTTKHAALGFADSLAITHHDQGIRVSALCPQGVQTPMVESVAGMDDGGPAGMDGMLTADQVADAAIKGLIAEQFLILPHEEVADYIKLKADNYDRWLGGMRKLRRTYKFPEPTF